MNLSRAATRLALIVILSSSVSIPSAQAQGRGQDSLSIQQGAALRLLNGAIDMHFHMDPPTAIWPGASIDNIRAARLLGVRGLVLKSHGESTAGLAYQLGRGMPDMTLIGGITLNRTVGGINLAAVEHLASIRGRPGRIVWLPTVDSRASAERNPGNAYVPLSENGKLLPEVRDLIAFMGDENLVLATGHSAPEDALLALEEGRARGLEHMIATHPMDGVGKMNMEQMEQAARLGAILELDFRHLVEEGGIEVIRKVGPEHVFISEFWTYQLWPPSSDPFRPIEYGGLERVGRFVEAMHAAGITDGELDMMVKTNPARLLGLPLE